MLPLSYLFTLLMAVTGELNGGSLTLIKDKNGTKYFITATVVGSGRTLRASKKEVEP